MSGTVALVRSPLAASYDFGSGHPMRAARAELAIELAIALKVMDRPAWRELVAEPASLTELSLVHDEAFIGLVRSADRAPVQILNAFGLATADTPVFPGMHEAASAVVGGSLLAARAVWAGQIAHAVSLVGGLHHAMRSCASGFCVYNDAAVAIADLLRAGCARIAYIDLDAHHGDGVEAAFAADPRVLTISIHQDGRTIFPGTGAAGDVGAPGAEGSAANIALPVGTPDGPWLRSFDAVVPVLLRSFRPEVVISQCGCDAHRDDPLTDLRVTVEGFAVAYRRIHELAHELSAGRWVALGGGGYDLGSAVPRSWAMLLAELSGASLGGECPLPEPWRVVSERLSGNPAPTHLGDGEPPAWEPWDAGEGDPDDLVDRAIAATRRAVLPLHGLDPFVDR
ncbi:MAG TPA: acetoin utilization protein AcuC [Mycobacteriales bacterium]|nr:acetoin utilization protein AcuC [Mycobacteriales bacterium]